MHTTIPGPLIRDRIITLTVCSRHGRPQTHRIQFTADSSPPGWSYAFIPLGLLIFVVIRAATRTRMALPWPFCDSCRARRRIVFGIAALQLALAITLVTLSTRIEHERTAGDLVALSLIPLATAYVTLYWTRLQVIARLKLSRDGYQLTVRKPAAAFVVEADTALRALAESAMTHQAAPAQPAAPPATVGPMGWRVPS